MTGSRRRAVLLSAPAPGLIARMDLLEGKGGAVRPVDYKKGAPGPQGPWEPEVIQPWAQGLALRENEASRSARTEARRRSASLLEAPAHRHSSVCASCVLDGPDSLRAWTPIGGEPTVSPGEARG